MIRTEQVEMPADVLQSFRVFVEARRWQWAKTYAATAPHWYTVRKWRPAHVDQEQFEQAVTTIREYGYDRRFYSKHYRSLTVDGFRYWTMGAPLDETIIINRCDANDRTGE